MSRFDKHMRVIRTTGSANIAEFKMNRTIERGLTPRNVGPLLTTGFKYGRAKALAKRARKAL